VINVENAYAGASAATHGAWKDILKRFAAGIDNFDRAQGDESYGVTVEFTVRYCVLNGTATEVAAAPIGTAISQTRTRRPGLLEEG
jgi:hypothetical protein